jgi:hypothetical protein
MRRVLLITAALILACGNVDTDGGHYPGMREFAPSGAGYHLHYANPPWVPLAPPGAYGAYRPDLVVELVYFGISLDLNAYLLQVEYLEGRAADVIHELRQTAAGGGEVIDFEVRSLDTSAGQTGLEFGSHGGQLAAGLPSSAQKTATEQGYTVRARRFAVDAPQGGCFTVLVLSIYDLDDPNLTYMLQSFDPRPIGDGGTAG